MSHYYVSHPTTLQDALTEYCASMAPDSARVVKDTIQNFLDSDVAREYGIRVEVKDHPQPEPKRTVL